MHQIKIKRERIMNLAANNVYPVQYLNDLKGFKPFVNRIKDTEFYPLKSKAAINTLQVNVGKVCNLMCQHCHVEAGPHRTESMARDTMYQCLKILADNKIPVLDITGGAPELNPNLSWFIKEARQLGCHVMVRTNLTILGTEKYCYLPEFYADHDVEIISSLPCYTEENTDGQRGQGVFVSSIEVLLRLNHLGYGLKDGYLQLNLAYNPGGPFLPPPQKVLEDEYRRKLSDQYGISFNNLYTMTNVPVGRFLDFLTDSGNLQLYIQYLASNFNAATVSEVMCRDQISVGWDGQVYDCDFNQMLGLNCSCSHIKDFSLEAFKKREIVLGNHCYACTASSGSSCRGVIETT